MYWIDCANGIGGKLDELKTQAEGLGKRLVEIGNLAMGGAA
jgi:hypothetical protein